MIISALLAVVALPIRTLNPIHHYTLGEVDNYSAVQEFDSPNSPVAIGYRFSEKVVNLNSSGGADIDGGTTNEIISVSGTDIRVEGSQIVRRTYDAFGEPTSNYDVVQTSIATRIPSNYFGRQELVIGETKNFDEQDRSNDKNHTKSTITLERIEDGHADLRVIRDIFLETLRKPIHLEYEVTVDAATCKLIKSTCKARNIPDTDDPGCPQSVSATFFIQSEVSKE
jgi:hypothetical protein